MHIRKALCAEYLDLDFLQVMILDRCFENGVATIISLRAGSSDVMSFVPRCPEQVSVYRPKSLKRLADLCHLAQFLILDQILIGRQVWAFVNVTLWLHGS